MKEEKIGRFVLKSGNLARLFTSGGKWTIMVPKSSLENGDIVCELEAKAVGLVREE